MVNFFHLVMPHCEVLFNQLQKRGIDVILVKNYIESFKASIQNVRDKIVNEISLESLHLPHLV